MDELENSQRTSKTRPQKQKVFRDAFPQSTTWLAAERRVSRLISVFFLRGSFRFAFARLTKEHAAEEIHVFSRFLDFLGIVVCGVCQPEKQQCAMTQHVQLNRREENTTLPQREGESCTSKNLSP